MQVTIHGKQIDLGETLQTHVEDKLEDINEKYFNHATDATVTFSKEGHGRGLIKAQIAIRVGKDIMVRAESKNPDPYAAFDDAAEKTAKQLRRYKKRLRDHHDRMADSVQHEITKARDYTLAALPDETEETMSEEGETDTPVVVAEMTTNIQTMRVSDAVMRLDLSGQPALMFRNSEHGEMNMVYRRSDGHVGWVDPSQNESLQNHIQKSA